MGYNSTGIIKKWHTCTLVHVHVHVHTSRLILLREKDPYSCYNPERKRERNNKEKEINREIKNEKEKRGDN